MLRVKLFAELRRTTRDGGHVIVVEHVRNLANLLVYGPGAFHFLPPMALATAVYSLFLIPRLKAAPWQLPQGGFAWLAGGSLVLGLQSLLLTAVIGIYGQVTMVNILFSSRGLWNFALIWFIGHWFRNTERQAGTGVMARRLVGAALMFAAIVMVSVWR